MALDIWSTDPNNKPKERVSFSDDTVGQFHSGYTDTDAKGNNIPVALDKWRVSTGDPVVADAVAQLLGGQPDVTDRASEKNIDVFTNQEKVLVVVDGPKALYSDMKLWNGNKLVHHCTGTKYLSPEERAGKPCGCPELFAERKAAAKDRMGPSPAISLTFRLADDPTLGKFKFQTASWVMASILHEYENALEAVGGPALIELSLELVEFTIKKGSNKGLAVSYYKPVLKVLKAYEDAITDDVTEEYVNDGSEPPY